MSGVWNGAVAVRHGQLGEFALIIREVVSALVSGVRIIVENTGDDPVSVPSRMILGPIIALVGHHSLWGLIDQVSIRFPAQVRRAAPHESS
ncbi:MAG TPA: hypothetical protein PKD12_07295 [Nitrospira sp.]|nr:hypothetical protein [Nitrospira sp.]